MTFEALPDISDPKFPHGTYRGYQVERKRLGAANVCDACREANNAYHREINARKTPGILRARERMAARQRAAVIVASARPRVFAKEIDRQLRLIQERRQQDGEAS